MRRVLVSLLLSTAALFAQEPVLTNYIGMEFALIRPGTMQVGVFEPTCPAPNPTAPLRAGADPKTQWTEQDYKRCEERVKQDRSPGFPVEIKNAFYIGNAWEWVQDTYNEKLFADPVPQKSGEEHVLKGGGFISNVKNVIYATHGAGPGDGWDVGFRVVREVK